MQNPFEQQLRSYRSSSLTGTALEAPLPLALGSEDVSGDEETRVFECDIGDLQIIAATGSCQRQQLTARPWISLLYVVWGEIAIVQSGLQICGNSGGCMLIPPSPAMWQSEAFSVVCLMLMPHRLAGLMPTRGADPNAVKVAPTPLLTARVFTRERGLQERQLLELLESNLRAVAAFQSQDPQLIEHLLLPDQLVSIIAALACVAPVDQRSEQPQQQRGPAGMQAALDDLIAFIQANLDQPLNLAVLENHTHYSKRALQYAFRQRLGCTPSQWIRSQRLDQAYQQLQHAEASDSVSRIALRCGYHSVSLFSLDFQQRFHIKPSHLLRQGRQQA
jgi:AraC-like DNA-binding protein